MSTEPQLEPRSGRAIRTKLDWKDYEELPEDGKRYEILNGDLFVSPSPSVNHQRIVGRLYRLLFAALEATGKGEVFLSPLDVRLSRFDIVQPDLVFISNERLGIVGDKIIGAPDMAVEVLSKSTRNRDRGVKHRRYAKTGVSMYWLVDPFKKLLEVSQLDGKTYRSVAVTCAPHTYESREFPGLRVDLAALFA